MTDSSKLTATRSRPCIMVEGKIGMYDLHLPLTIDQAKDLRAALDAALAEDEQ